MATARVALSSVLSTVDSAATAVSQTFNTITTGVDMVHALAANAAKHQKLRHAAEDSSFEAALAEEISMIDTTRQLEIIQFMNQSNDHKEIFTSNLNRIQKAIEDAKSA